jgi:cytidylate kinase
MALIAVSGHPGCRFEEVARFSAQRLGFELLTQARIRTLIREEFGEALQIPDKAYPSLVTSILAHIATEHHVVYCAVGGEVQARHFPGMLRIHVTAPENIRVGNLMLDHRLDRVAARKLLLEMEAADRADRKAKFGKTKATAELFDVVLNAESLTTEQMAELIETAVTSSGLKERGYLSQAAEAQLQFQMRFRLSRYGIVPPGNVTLRKKMFANASEEIFANLLDFYRIAWEYEPRSFPLQWDKDGRITEAFTPDFYLPEFDLYVELTTMKQALVTRKNRKIKLLRAVYPHINIQVFYQKDFQDLVFKHGLKVAAR